MQCYPLAFVQTTSKQSIPTECDPKAEHGNGKPILMMVPYIAGISERFSKACRNNFKVVFKSGPTFSSLLEDPLFAGKLANVM